MSSLKTKCLTIFLLVIPIAIGITVPIFASAVARMIHLNISIYLSITYYIDYYLDSGFIPFFIMHLAPFVIVIYISFNTWKPGCVMVEGFSKWLGGFFMATASTFFINYINKSMILQDSPSEGLEMLTLPAYVFGAIPLTFLGIWLGKKVFYLLGKGNKEG